MLQHPLSRNWPKLWEGRNGQTGYSPAYRRIWGIHAQKNSKEPKEYFPLTDQVVHDHLTGKLTAGIYPLLTDETCWFLAADFDKATWQDDVREFLHTCGEWKVPAVLERLRSGRGGHVWIFFEAPLPASLAREEFAPLSCARAKRILPHRNLTRTGFVVPAASSPIVCAPAPSVPWLYPAISRKESCETGAVSRMPSARKAESWLAE